MYVDLYSSSMVCTKTWKTPHDTASLSIFTQLNMETNLFQAPSSKEHSEQMGDQGSVFCATGIVGYPVPSAVACFMPMKILAMLS